MIVSIAWFRRDEYQKLLSLFTDSRRLPSYDAWLTHARRAEQLVDAAGYPCARIYVSPMNSNHGMQADKQNLTPPAEIVYRANAAALYDA
jgi:hypothetical protein